MSPQDAILFVATGSVIGSVVILTVLWRLVADISENVMRIESWASEILRKVDPKNPLVCVDQSSPRPAEYSTGSTLHFRIRIEPEFFMSGELED